MKIQRGFTLLELMAVIFIVAILAAIAFPNYQRIAIKNAESDARAHIGQIQLQLDRWRATRLSYKGFVPNTGKAMTYGEGGVNGTIIYVPFGSTADNYRYQIELVTVESGETSSLNPSSKDKILVARSWAMRATPNPNGIAANKGKVFLQNSTGLKCATLDRNKGAMPITATACSGTGLETW